MSDVTPEITPEIEVEPIQAETPPEPQQDDLGIVTTPDPNDTDPEPMPEDGGMPLTGTGEDVESNDGAMPTEEEQAAEEQTE